MRLPFILVLCLLVASNCMTMVPPVEDYFPQLNGDLTKLEWAHAVNNQKLLEEALANDAVMMIEADVILGHLNGALKRTPVMGHPPAIVSNLSLEQFVQAVIDFQTKGKRGIKLDFKSDDAFSESSKILEALKDKFTFPVWLNADILPGPVDATNKPLDAKAFLNLSHQLLPQAVLSVGWTTNFKVGSGGYTEEQVNAMQAAIESAQVTQPVTLAVRAAFAALSPDNMISLVSAIDKYQQGNETTLTVWQSNDSDVVDVPALRELILRLGKDRVALDVPEAIRSALHLDGRGTGSPITAAHGALVAVLSSITAALNKIVHLF